MKNKNELIKYLKIGFILIIIFTIIFVIIQRIEYKRYTSVFNDKINTFAILLKQKNPEISDDEIIEILNNTNNTNEFHNNENPIFEKYSIDLNTESVLVKNNKYYIIYTIISVILLIISMLSIIIIFLKYNKTKYKQIDSITKSIQQINKKNYKIDLDEMSEGELSILKSEIYKTTIMLKEQAENSLQDKIKLKQSLSDISHQLKTPLTSITIMIDNIIDNPDMEHEIRDDFIKEIKIEISNINFLVQSLLKLSKFDSNTVEYIKKDMKISELINISAKRLLPLCDLKNIKLNINIKKDSIINCDEMWQVEALANIIKNCVEHSQKGSKVDIIADKNNVYSFIKIIDYGTGINKKDLPHIFERFYKGKNSDSNGIGIGLALAKTIIDKNNGTISVESEEGKGTVFVIKYFV